MVRMGGGSLQWVARAVSVERLKHGICERLGVQFPGATRREGRAFGHRLLSYSTCGCRPGSDWQQVSATTTTLPFCDRRRGLAA